MPQLHLFQLNHQSMRIVHDCQLHLMHQPDPLQLMLTQLLPNKLYMLSLQSAELPHMPEPNLLPDLQLDGFLLLNKRVLLLLRPYPQHLHQLHLPVMPTLLPLTLSQLLLTHSVQCV